jgi:type VII secretion-associated protein (TIGR03931 family)
VTLRVAVDFGTSSTCVVASVNGREPQVVVIDGQPLMSSAVYAAADGTLFVGQEAERQAAVDPSRYEPNPKRRIDEGELLLGDTVLRVTEVVHAVLQRAVTEARTLAGGAEIDLLVLTHPAEWGAVRARLLRQAAGGLAREVALVPEPVAAAVFHAATFSASDLPADRAVEVNGRPGETLAVLDLGGGTVDVSVVRRSAGVDHTGRPSRGFEVLATRGDPSFGGADVDQALLEHVGSLVASADPDAWQQLVEGRALVDRRRRRALRQDVRGAKETLSRHAYTDVPMPPPFADAHVTREDLERLIVAPLGRIVELARGAIEDAGLRPKQLSAIFLVGGSSRIPMISRLVYERTGVVPTTLDQPETVVARGALRAVQAELDRSAAGARGAFSGLNAPASASVGQRTEIVRPVSGFAPARQPRAPGATFSPLNAPHRGTGPQVAPRPGPQWRGGEMEAPKGPVAAERPKRKSKAPWLIGAAVLLVGVAVGGVLIAVNGDGAPTAGRTFSQYDYHFSTPSDWSQTGDNAAAKQVVVRPADAQTGNDLVVAQEIDMDFDATADRQQLVDFLQGVAKKSTIYSQFNSDTTYAGRQVISYLETKEAATVDWYVVAQGKVRVHVGCQYATASPQHDRVASACEQVVRTLAIGN